MTTATQVNNTSHLAQLEGDARAVATEGCRRWPDFVITSSKRDVQTQAVAMARNVARQRTWILGDAHTAGTYRYSLCAKLLHDWAVSNPHALEHEVAAAFAHLMEGLPTSELEKLSSHLAPYAQGAHAFDVLPLLTAIGAEQARKVAAGELPVTFPVEFTPEGTEICNFLAAEAKRLGATFLTREGKLVICHWQAKRS